MLKHSLWKPSTVIHNTAITPLLERWNLIRLERLHNHILSSSFLSKLHKAFQSTGPCHFQHLWFICDSWPFIAPLCLKPGDKVTSAARCLQPVCSWLRRHKASEAGALPVEFHERLKAFRVPQLSKLVSYTTKENKSSMSLSQKFLWPRPSCVISLFKHKIGKTKLHLNGRNAP